MGKRSETGFTLIEMLVALSIFSIAALSLLRLDTFAVATAADLDGRAMANLVAQNEAALMLTDPAPVVRGRTTATLVNGGRQFSVERSITPTPDQRLVRVDLLVTEAGGQARARLTFVKRAS